MSATSYGAQRQLHILRRLLPETIRKRHPDTISCYQCGKPVKAKDAVMQDKRVLCQECYNTLHADKDLAKE